MSVADEARLRFVGDTADHQLEIRHDDGLYRHLRCAKPGTSIYSFNIVTWPGYLAVAGDAGDWLFARVPDMFEFFGRSHGINPQYWSEKLQAPRPEGALTYSYDLYKSRVLEWLREASVDVDVEARDGLRNAVDEQLLAEWLDAAHSEYEAHRLLAEFVHEHTRIHDGWEWSLREYRFDFLWCCHAILWGIERYREAKTA